MTHNEPSTLLKQIIALFNFDPCHDHLEPLCADLAARLADSDGVCVAVVKSHLLPSFFGMLSVLRPFGVSASYRSLETHNARLIFLKIDLSEQESEWVGATCRAVRLLEPAGAVA